MQVLCAEGDGLIVFFLGEERHCSRGIEEGEAVMSQGSRVEWVMVMIIPLPLLGTVVLFQLADERSPLASVMQPRESRGGDTARSLLLSLFIEDKSNSRRWSRPQYGQACGM